MATTATLAQLRNLICSDLNRTSAGDMTSSVETEIRTSIKFYEKERFRFLEAQATSPTVAGEEYMSLPDNFRDMDALHITVSGFDYQLIERTFNQIEAWAFSQNTSAPTDYALYGEQIRLYPIPDNTYTVTMSYYRELDELTATNSGNAWTNDGQGLIRSRTLWTLYARQLKDYDAAQAAKSLTDEELSQHRRITALNAHSGYTTKRQ